MADNLEDGIPAALPHELVTTLVQAEGVRIERVVSRGHASPPGFWYDQAEDEFVLLVEGEAGLELEGQPEVRLRRGDWLVLPAHARHRVAWTAPDRDTLWLCVFYRAIRGHSPRGANGTL
jgi:cupin 2 domain-containing protein